VSSPLAIAAVTLVLKDLLNNGLIDHDLSQVGSFTVSASPPDRITTGDTEPNRLNLFLYQVTPNPGWRNEGLPSFASQGGRLTNPPLALDLHYLLSAYGHVDLNAEILLGYAMELLHDKPVITRAEIRRSLTPGNPVPVNLIPPDPQGRQAIDLADQVELIKIAPHYLTADELSKLWTAMQARYRPTLAYQVSTVLIQGTRPARAALPVLKRGKTDGGVQSQPSVGQPLPSLPTLLDAEILPADGKGPRSTVELGDTLALSGALLGGDTVVAEFTHRLFAKALELPRAAGSTAERAVFAIPDAAAGTTASDWPPGAYTVALRIETAGKAPRRTNALVFNFAPRVKPAPTVAAGAGGALDLTLQFAPQIWPGQHVDVFVGADAFQPAKIEAKVAMLKLSIKGVTPSDVPVPVRLRVDGVDSIVVRDKTLQPPQFDPQQSITLPA
jgi:hypothetical protein